MAKACTQGLIAGWLHVGLVTAGQFATVDAFVFSGGSSRSHLHDPMEMNFLPEHNGHEKMSKHGNMQTCSEALRMPTAKGCLFET